MKSFFKKETEEHREARAILRQPPVDVKPYTPRFNMNTITFDERFKVSLFYGIRTAYREYLDYCSWSGYKSLSAADYLLEEIKRSINYCKQPKEYINTITEVIMRYDLGKDGKKGTYNPTLNLEMYNQIIEKIKCN